MKNLRGFWGTKNRVQDMVPTGVKCIALFMNYATPIAQVRRVADYDRRAAATRARFIFNYFMNY